MSRRVITQPPADYAGDCLWMDIQLRHYDWLIHGLISHHVLIFCPEGADRDALEEEMQAIGIPYAEILPDTDPGTRWDYIYHPDKYPVLVTSDSCARYYDSGAFDAVVLMGTIGSRWVAQHWMLLAKPDGYIIDYAQNFEVKNG